jgi:hypothetical protein
MQDGFAGAVNKAGITGLTVGITIDKWSRISVHWKASPM